MTDDQFEIIEQRKRGVQSYQDKYPDDALIVVNKSIFTIHAKAVSLLDLKQKDRVIIARQEGVFYIAKLNEMSTQKGYTVTKRKNQNSFYCCSDSFARHDVQNAIYKISDDEDTKIVKNNLDWYELQSINND